ncbi:MAG: Crp/Fnr family transcriptional regulator [Flavobacterium sp.]
MIAMLRKHITDRLGHDTANLDTVLLSFRQVKAVRNEMLLRQGEICKEVFFVASGCLQVFVHDSAGNETTRDIVMEDSWCSELISFGSQCPAAENIRAVEPSVLYAIDRAGFSMMMAQVPQFDKVYRQVLEASYANSVYRLNAFASMNALERTRWLMQYRPRLASRLPGKLIASYLGISQETFSRLKGKL